MWHVGLPMTSGFGADPLPLSNHGILLRRYQTDFGGPQFLAMTLQQHIDYAAITEVLLSQPPLEYARRPTCFAVLTSPSSHLLMSCVCAVACFRLYSC